MSARYKVLSHLGRGGIGLVTRCLDTQLNREVAVKRLLPLEKTRLNQSAAETIEREATALAAFHHPNVVTMHEFGEDEDGPYVVTELIDGESLEACIKQGAVSVGDFLDLAAQMLDALITAHEIDLIHRDIKPANIMLTRLPNGRFQAKVLDFGLSKFTSRPRKQTLDHKGHFLCSIDYVAPEQIDRGLIDHRVDLYSLACVLYYSLVQKPPFKSDCGAETLRRHLDHNFVPIREIRPDLPQPMAHWLERMMALEPDDRPGNALEALQEFEAARDHGISPPVQWNPVASPSSSKSKTDSEIQVTARPEKVEISHHIAPTRPVQSLNLERLRSPDSKKRKKEEPGFPQKLLAPLVGLGCLVAIGIGYLATMGANAEKKSARTKSDNAQVIEVESAGNIESN